MTDPELERAKELCGTRGMTTHWCQYSMEEDEMCDVQMGKLECRSKTGKGENDEA
jgi:hypothetical protein